jgi:hypothetical protein
MKGKGLAGSLAIYINQDGIPIHAGKFDGARIISKWGAGPTNIWIHAPEEVPQQYGDEVLFYSMPIEPFDLYRRWAQVELAR